MVQATKDNGPLKNICVYLNVKTSQKIYRHIEYKIVCTFFFVVDDLIGPPELSIAGSRACPGAGRLRLRKVDSEWETADCGL